LFQFKLDRCPRDRTACVLRPPHNTRSRPHTPAGQLRNRIGEPLDPYKLIGALTAYTEQLRDFTDPNQAGLHRPEFTLRKDYQQGAVSSAATDPLELGDHREHVEQEPPDPIRRAMD
jgi:hypothetical protein